MEYIKVDLTVALSMIDSNDNDNGLSNNYNKHLYEVGMQ
jgi:hypothetical protein